MTNPVTEISIIMPTYNGEKFISQAIESVLSQSFQLWELLIFDDGSTDSTPSIIQKYRDSDMRIQIITTPGIKQYTTGGRNECIKSSKGVYICLLDHDDIWLSTDKLKIQLDAFQKNVGVGICGTNYNIIDQNGYIKGEKIMPATETSIKKNILLYSPFVPCSVMIRKNLLDQYGIFDPAYDKVDDYELWLRLGQYTQYINIQQFLTGYRVHTTNTSFKWKNLWKMKYLDFLLFQKYKHIFPLTTEKIYIKCLAIFFPYEVLLRYPKIVEVIKKVI